MLKSFQYNKSKSTQKGQWFLISAVIVTGAFLSISLSLKDYFVADASEQASGREDHFLSNVQEQFVQVAEQSSCGPANSEIERNLNRFIAFTTASLAKSGYFVHIEYSKTPGKTKSYAFDCDEDNPATPLVNERKRIVEKGIIVASEGRVYYYNINPALVITGF